MKRSILFLAFFIIISGLASCDDIGNSDPVLPPVPATVIPIITTFNATLNGENEVPSNSSAATGTAILTLNETAKTFTLTVTYSGLTPTDGHIHLTASVPGGINGPIVFPLTSGLTSPITYISTELTAEQVKDISANRYYVNLHSRAFPDGEIRGQLIANGTADPLIPHYEATLNGMNEVPPNASSATGTAEFTFNYATKRISMTVTHNVVGATSAHIHKGGIGTNGDIVFSLESASATTYAYRSSALTTIQEAEFLNGFYYVDIHSAAPYNEGEIRGQLLYSDWDWDWDWK